MPQRVEEIEIPGLAWDTGAPEPVVVASERRCLFAFHIRDNAPWTLEDPPHDDAAVFEFVGCLAVTTGFPNEEVLHGHPLYAHGLTFYAAHVVHDSEWIAALQRIEDHHDRPYPIDARHYVLTFHDSTLEAVAEDIRPVGTFATMQGAVAHMASLAY